MPALFDEIFNFKTLEMAYRKASAGQEKFKAEALLFARNDVANLLSLQRKLYDKSYTFSGYIKFKVYEPKERIIHAPHFVDKIVQLSMHSVLTPLIMKSFIPESYSCLPGRGTHKAINKVQQNLIRGKARWGDSSYVLKLDIKKFFYTIDRNILKELYRAKISDPEVLRVMDIITDSADEISTVGVPLGNTMSQLYSNIYLDRLDQYCKRYLGYRYYCRYADDVIIVLADKGVAQEAKKLCAAFLADSLHLDINTKKTQIFPIKNGVNAFGFKIKPNYRLLRNDSKRKIKRKIRKMPSLIKEGRMTAETANQILASWSGHAKHGSTQNFARSLVERWPYLIMDEKGIIKIKDKYF